MFCYKLISILKSKLLMGINCFWDFPQQILVKMAQSNKKRREEQKRRLE